MTTGSPSDYKVKKEFENTGVTGVGYRRGGYDGYGTVLNTGDLVVNAVKDLARGTSADLVIVVVICEHGGAIHHPRNFGRVDKPV